MKLSIRKSIIALFALEILAIVIVSALFSYRNAYTMAVHENENWARSAARLTQDILGERGINTLMNPEKPSRAEYYRERMRTICKGYSLSYIYLYSIDEQGVRHFYMTVAADDEQDEIVRKSRGYGAVSDRPLHEQEAAALNDQISSKACIVNNQFGREMAWFTPYHDSDGNVIAIIGTDNSVDLRNAEILHQFIRTVIPFLAIVLGALAVLYSILAKRVVKPLKKITVRMNEFDPAAEFEPLDIHTGDEMEVIADSFTSLVNDIHVYLDNIKKITAEQQKKKTEMHFARRIQYGMVPEEWRVRRNGVNAAALMKPAREVGGDFYDGFFLDDGRFCAVIGDVSGKGIPGAMFMVLVKSSLRNHLKQDSGPAASLNMLNEELCLENPEGLFATVFAMILDPQTGRVTYANGGHNPPVMIRNRTAEYLNPDPGIALGLFNDAGIKDEELVLEEGDGILLYTDGITEAVSADRKFYGAERLLETVRACRTPDSKLLNDAVKQSVLTFCAGSEQFDDVTLMSVFHERHGISELSLPASMESFETVKNEIITRYGTGESVKNALLACEEAFVNIAEYSGASKITALLDKETDRLTVVFKDNGIRFDPFAAENRQEKEFEEKDQGGMGIGLIRQLVSEADWQYIDGENVLTMKFEHIRAGDQL
jgi:sigma-B regulation protein RsbU (phosphoserine phosphatase)